MLITATSALAAALLAAPLILPSEGSGEQQVSFTGTTSSAQVGLEVEDPGSSGPGEGNSRSESAPGIQKGPDSKGGARTSTCTYSGNEVPCRKQGATWSNERRCWVRLTDPQPPPEMSVWDGHLDADGEPTGKIYDCLTPSGTGAGMLSWDSHAFWAPTDPTAGQVDPEVLAQRAVDQMNLRAGGLGATPLPGPQAASVVGLPTWLWVDSPDAHTWGPARRTVTAGAVSVTATAQVSEVVYDMGDGGSLTCTTPGTPWTRSAGDADSPDCGYRYQGPGQFRVTATSHWVVDWRGAGQSGRIAFQLTSERDITVTEIQVLVTE